MLALDITSNRGPIWDEAEAWAARLSAHPQAGGTTALVESLSTGSVVEPRPLPLNTVALLQKASAEIGLGPADTLHYAESLYLKGLTSYPRTETSRYPAQFDLPGTVRMLAQQKSAREAGSKIAPEAQAVHVKGIVAPRDDGEDAGDHPPITPVKIAQSANACGGEAAHAVYMLICRHFLATVSEDAVYITEVTL